MNSLASAQIGPHHEGEPPWSGPQVALVDLLDRLLAGGVLLTGDLTLAIADVDLVHILLRAVISSIDPATPHLGDVGPGHPGNEHDEGRGRVGDRGDGAGVR
jgi:hypothetical protein